MKKMSKREPKIHRRMRIPNDDFPPGDDGVRRLAKMVIEMWKEQREFRDEIVPRIKDLETYVKTQKKKRQVTIQFISAILRKIAVPLITAAVTAVVTYFVTIA